MFCAVPASSTSAPGTRGAAASGRLRLAELTSIVSVAASPGATRSGSSLASIESLPSGELPARAAPWSRASVARTQPTFLPVTISVLLIRFSLVLLAVGAALRFKRLQPVFRFTLRERAGAASRRRRRGPARSRGWILISLRRGRARASRGRALPILWIGLPHLPQCFFQVLLRVHVAGHETQRLPVGP